jgi:hypothetical protein
MNTTILSKCVDELKKDTPNIQYVLGMLETLVTMGNPMPVYPPIYSTGQNIPVGNIPTYPTIMSANNEHVDEEIIPDFVKPGPIGKINS